MQQLVIYKTGATGLQTTVTNGYCDFSAVRRENGGGNYKVAEYLELLGQGFVCTTFKDALRQIDNALNAEYHKPWQEITEDDYTYALEVLPPEQWRTVEGVNIFRMPEYLIANVTAHYAIHNNRYFMADRRTSCNYSDLAKEVKDQPNQ